MGLMKKVVKSPLIVNVITINGVQRSLERLADLLQKIQKALGEYLERERAGFPRYKDIFSSVRKIKLFFPCLDPMHMYMNIFGAIFL